MLYCGMCGTHLARECFSCHAVVPLDFRFCGKCGASLEPFHQNLLDIENGATTALATDAQIIKKSPFAPEQGQPNLSRISPFGERRLATILIADVKGSTQLMEILGTETWVDVMNQTLQVMSEEVNRFGGEVDQFRGDGLVAFFGARSAHEDDPERAVVAGQMMQLAVQRLSQEIFEIYGVEISIRVGINTGEVISGYIGNIAQHHEDTSMGGAVALAARIESVAEPGTVLVSEGTYRLTKHLYDWESLGSIELRGISSPVAVFRPLAPLSESEQEHRLRAYGLSGQLIGRERESELLHKNLKEVRNGVGSIVLVSGEAGLGKSRLISEVEQTVKREDALLSGGGKPITWLRGRCISYGRSLPHSMWLDVLYSWLGINTWPNQEELMERLLWHSQELWGEQYAQYYPYLAKFLSLPVEETFLDWMDYLEAEGLRQQFFLSISSWVKALAQRGPVVIVFTEAHWADEASLALLKHCLPLCENFPISWMLFYRPDQTSLIWDFSREIEDDFPHRLTTVELSPLTSSESDMFLNLLIGGNILPPNLQKEIIEKAEGNPYYLVEIVRSLIDRQILTRISERNQWKITQSDVSVDLPNSLVGLLASRITQLSAIEQRLLQLAAVIGSVFWSKILRVLVDQNIPVEAHLTSLQRAGFIRERASFSDLGREYMFLSALMRDAAYESLLSAQRSDLHQEIANFLEELLTEKPAPQYHGMIAYHYRQAGICHKELFHLLLAAKNSQRIYANEAAIREYQRALVLLDELDVCDEILSQVNINESRLEILSGLGKIYFGIGESSQAEEYFRSAITVGRQMGLNVLELTRLFYWLGETLFWQNKFEEPIHLGEEGLYYLGENNKNVEAALMNQLVAIGCAQLDDHEKFIEYTRRNAGFIQALPYTEELRPAYVHIINLYAYTLKDIPAAEHWLSVLREKAEEHNDLRAVGEVYNETAYLANRQGKLDIAFRYYDKAIEQFNRIGDDKHTCRALRRLAACYLQAGRLEEAAGKIERSLEKAETLNNPIDFAMGYWFKAQIQLCQGFSVEAAATFAKAQAYAKEVTVYKGGWAFLGLDRAHYPQSNASEILGNYRSALEDDPQLIYRYPYQAVNEISKLERSFRATDDFRAYVDQFRQAHPELQHAQFQQWYLVPGEITQHHNDPILLDFSHDPIPDDWIWVDPLEDCSFHLARGLTIQAANEHNLYHINNSAPRIVRKESIKRDFTVQVVCMAAAEDKPAIGGLLFWQDDKNWLCLELGARGQDEIIFRGFKDNQDMVFGRGRLKAVTTFLRLEKKGYQVTTYCSSDGKTWFHLGRTTMPTGEPISPGLLANGHINRIIYPGAFVDGTAIQFKELRLWIGS
jgi:class 3 adenylate cyclase/predicted ATPase